MSEVRLEVSILMETHKKTFKALVELLIISAFRKMQTTHEEYFFRIILSYYMWV